MPSASDEQHSVILPSMWYIGFGQFKALRGFQQRKRDIKIPTLWAKCNAIISSWSGCTNSCKRSAVVAGLGVRHDFDANIQISRSAASGLALLVRSSRMNISLSIVDYVMNWELTEKCVLHETHDYFTFIQPMKSLIVGVVVDVVQSWTP